MSSFLSLLDNFPNDPMDISFILYPVPLLLYFNVILVYLPLLTRTYRATILCTLPCAPVLCFGIQYILGHLWVPVVPCRCGVNE